MLRNGGETLFTIAPPLSVWNVLGAIGNVVMYLASILMIAQIVPIAGWAWVLTLYGIVLAVFFIVVVIGSVPGLVNRLVRGRTKGAASYFTLAQAIPSAVGYTVTSMALLYLLLVHSAAELELPINVSTLRILLSLNAVTALLGLFLGPVNIVGQMNRMKRIIGDGELARQLPLEDEEDQ